MDSKATGRTATPRVRGSRPRSRSVNQRSGQQRTLRNPLKPLEVAESPTLPFSSPLPPIETETRHREREDRPSAFLDAPDWLTERRLRSACDQFEAKPICIAREL